jgi:hypothetical protein
MVPNSLRRQIGRTLASLVTVSFSHMFDYLASQPALFADFNLFMGATPGGHTYWWEWYDFQGQLLDGYDKSKGDGLLVDVGGGQRTRSKGLS